MEQQAVDAGSIDGMRVVQRKTNCRYRASLSFQPYQLAELRRWDGALLE
jgi:hypothetical protein